MTGKRQREQDATFDDTSRKPYQYAQKQHKSSNVQSSSAKDAVSAPHAIADDTHCNKDFTSDNTTVSCVPITASLVSDDVKMFSREVPDDIPYSEIVSLQFGRYTSEEVDALAVRELDVVSNKKNLRAGGTVNCNSQGPVDANSLCNTCGDNYEGCQNHHAKFTLKHPIFNVHDYPTAVKTLPSLCYRCGRIMAPMSLIRSTVRPGGPVRKNNQEIYKLCMRYRVCWFPDDPDELAAAHKKPKQTKSKPAPKNSTQQQQQQTSDHPDLENHNDHDHDDENDENEISKGNNLPEVFPNDNDDGVDSKEPEISAFGDSIEWDENCKYERPHVLTKLEADKRGYCGARQPAFWARVENVLLRPIFVIDSKKEWDTLPVITPEQIYRVLKYASPQTVSLFGFNPEYSPLHSMMIKTMLVPVTLTRPLRSAMGSEDDITHTLRKIQEYNLNWDKDAVPNLTMALLRKSTSQKLTPTLALKRLERIQQLPMSNRLKHHKVSIASESLDDWFLVQREAGCLQDSKFHFLLDKEHGREPYCLKRRFASSKRGNKGRMRGYLLGKRGNYCCRGVGSPNTNIDIDQIAVPRRFMMHVTTKEVVTEHNFQKMMTLVLRGPNVYPGCNFVERNREKYLPDACLGGLRLGDVVHRHLVDGDVVIANRQPSLWRWAIMGYRLVLSEDSTIQGNLAVTTALNEDYDGDEKNVWVPQEELERTEVATLLNVRRHLMKDGNLMIGFVQHAVLGAYKLTEQVRKRGDEHIFDIDPDHEKLNDEKQSDVDGQSNNNKNNLPEFQSKLHFDVSEVHEYLKIGANEWCIDDCILRWQELFHGKSLTGRQFMQVLLPSYHGCDGDTSEPLNKSKLNSLIASTIEIASDMEVAAFRISFLIRIFETIAFTCGISLNIDDLLLETPSSVYCEAEDVLYIAEQLSEVAERFLSLGENGEGMNDEQADEEEALERDISTLTEEHRQTLGRHAMQVLTKQRQYSGVLDAIQSSAKGSVANIVQNSTVVGQQLDDSNQRYKTSTAHYYRTSLARRSFVLRAFLDGLTPTEFFAHLRASRLGLISTACSTSDSGYLFRKILKNMEDIRIVADNSARNALNQILLFRYGFDTSLLQTVVVKSMSMSPDEIVQTFGTEVGHGNTCGVDEIEFLLQRREVALQVEPATGVALPLKFDKQMKCSAEQPNINVKPGYEKLSSIRRKESQKRAKKCAHVPVTADDARNQVFALWVYLVTEFNVPNSPLMELAYFENMAIRTLQERGLLTCIHVFNDYIQYVGKCYSSNVCTTGDPVGMRSSQDTCAGLTQQNLKKFHFAGLKTTVSNSTTRLREIVNLNKVIENPGMQIFLKPEFENNFDPMSLIELKLSQIVTKYDDTFAMPLWEHHLQAIQKTSTHTDHEDNEFPIHPICGMDFEALINLTLYLDRNHLCERETTPREIAEMLLNSSTLQYDDGSLAITYPTIDGNVECVRNLVHTSLTAVPVLLPDNEENTWPRSPADRLVEGGDGKGWWITISLPRTNPIWVKLAPPPPTAAANARAAAAAAAATAAAAVVTSTASSVALVSATNTPTSSSNTSSSSSCSLLSTSMEHNRSASSSLPTEAESVYAVNANACEAAACAATAARRPVALLSAATSMQRPLLALLLHRCLVFNKQLLCGIQGIQDFSVDVENVVTRDTTIGMGGKLVSRSKKCIFTKGCNLAAVCSLPEVDLELTRCNDIHQTFAVFGIDAAQKCIEQEMALMMQQGDVSVSFQHIRLIAAAMCFMGSPSPLNFAGMTSKGTGSAFKKATFERSLQSFFDAGNSGLLDYVRGISEAIVVGKPISLGTGGDFELLDVPLTREQIIRAKSLRRKPQKLVVPTPLGFAEIAESPFISERVVVDLEPVQDVPTASTKRAATAMAASAARRAVRAASRVVAKEQMDKALAHFTEQHALLSSSGEFVPQLTKKQLKQQALLARLAEQHRRAQSSTVYGEDFPNFFGDMHEFLPTSPRRRSHSNANLKPVKKRPRTPKEPKQKPIKKPKIVKPKKPHKTTTPKIKKIKKS